MERAHITITGDLGSGKSSVARALTKELGYTYLSTGLIQRQLARERGMNTLELNKFSTNNSEIDDTLDNRLISINNDFDTYILDSRLAWHFVKNSFKIYLLTIPEVAANRVLQDLERKDEPIASDLTSVIDDLRERRQLENDRFRRLYGIECDKFRNYDIIIDTTTATVEQITTLILREYKKFIAGMPFIKIWLSPKRIFPTENIRGLSGDDAKELRERIKLDGYNESYPIAVVMNNKEFYIWDGHKRLSASLFSDVNLIPVLLVAKDQEEIIKSLTATAFVASAFNKSGFYDWEDVHGFRFSHYPKTSIIENI